MPNTRISDLTAATSVAGTDVYPSVQTAGVGPVKTSLTQITAFALANAPAGAVATPSIAPTGDTNTGFWFPAADTIAASTGGSERLRITSAGNVGIGTTSPTRKLHVLGGDSLNTMIVGASNALGIGSTASYGYLESLDTTGSVSYSPLWLGGSIIQLGISGSEAMRINSAGNVGIGMTPSVWASSVTALQLPTGAFYSFKSGSVSNFYMMANAYLNSGGSSAYKSTAAATQYVQTGGSHVWSYAASGTADAAITWFEAMRITSAGNIHTPAGSTGMTNGFFYMPAAAGAPSGTPTSISGTVPFYYDTTNNQFYVYNGAWKKVTLA